MEDVYSKMYSFSWNKEQYGGSLVTWKLFLKNDGYKVVQGIIIIDGLSSCHNLSITSLELLKISGRTYYYFTFMIFKKIN